jgi:adenine-specific DNA-methyltransferase
MQKFTAEDPETKSADVISDYLEALKALFPDAFTEGEIDFNVLRQLLGDKVDEDDEKYGLNWHGKRAARQLALTPSTGTLRPCPEESVNWDSTQNLMIEGDNLEVLKLLQKSYPSKVDVIYIDPPYNTGGDLVYPDNFRDGIGNYLELTGQLDNEGNRLATNSESSGRFHTAWLNMMYPRLRLARSLLSQAGILLVSIDDNEVVNLRRLCDEVLGEENFIASMVWEKGRKNDAKLISVGHEYLLVYAKSLPFLREARTVWREEKPGAREIWMEYLALRKKHGDSDKDVERGLQAWFSSLPAAHPAKKWSRYKRVDANGPWRDRDISWPGGGGPRYDVLHPVTQMPCVVPESGWRYASSDEMQRQIDRGLVEFRSDHTQPPFRKAHIRPIPDDDDSPSSTDDVENVDPNGGSGEDWEEFATQVRGSYFYKQSQVSVKMLRGLMGAKVFNNPKDHLELAKLVAYVTSGNPEAVVLDFFAGSGSTGHAVMSLNADDGGRRQFVLVQLPEPLDASKKNEKAGFKLCESLDAPTNIAELTKERLRRAGTATVGSDDPLVDLDVGFRVFKLDSSNIEAWEPDRSDLDGSLTDAIEHLKDDRTEDDILYELLLKLGLELTVPIETRAIAGKTVYNVGAGTLLVCLAESIDMGDVEAIGLGIAEWHAELDSAGDATVVFRDSAFADDVAKTNLTAILEQHGLSTVRSL